MPDKFTELTERAPLSDHEIEALVTDPVIREALIKLKMDVLISGWVVKGSSDAVALFCRHVLSRVWVEMVLSLLDAIPKGTQVLEVIWDIEDVKILGKSYSASVVPKSFYSLPRKQIKFLWDQEKREIAGVKYFKSGLSSRYEEILGEKVLWYSFGPTDRSWPFGLSILEKVRPLHEMFTDAMNLLGAYVENLTMPPIVGYAPTGEIRDPDTGEVIGGLEYLGRRLQELRASGIGVFPGDLTPEGHPRWRVDFQTGATPSGSVEIARILEILRQFKKEAIYSFGEAQTTMITGQLPVGLPGYVLRELLDALNKQIVKKLVFLNWGKEEWAYVEPADQAADIGLVRDIVRSSIQFSDVDRQRILKLLDWYALLQMFGLPLSMEEKEEEAPTGLGGLGLPALGSPGLSLGGFGGLGGLPAVTPAEQVLAQPEVPTPEIPKEERTWRAAIQGP